MGCGQVVVWKKSGFSDDVLSLQTALLFIYFTRVGVLVGVMDLGLV